ncbi:MAG: exonuclease subunit SbcD [Clostridiales bacterium]|jgi:exonuclease SbcD|nr:exonuclease subunit SbcD [Clostridiales bacterium]
MGYKLVLEALIMNILHTSDWHLGKYLEGYPRIAEQELFIDELCGICEEKEIELVIIAGDIYDSANPPAAAETLFYKAIMRLADDGRRKIIVAAGNHDSPARLLAISPLVFRQGIIILGTAKTVIPVGVYGGFEITRSGEGFFEMLVNGVGVVIGYLAYPSEKNIDSLIYNMEGSGQAQFSDKVKDIIDRINENFQEGSINIFIGHFYIAGGSMEKSERDISLGGSYAVSPGVLPKKADYIAMGHLHRPQAVAKTKNAFYSGSPIQYDKSERRHPKCVFVAKLDKIANQVEKIYLRNYKPIEVWEAGSIEEAIDMCKENRGKDCFVYLEIKTSRVLKQSEFKEILSAKKDIIEITPILEPDGYTKNQGFNNDKPIEEEFIEFYNAKRGVAPAGELIKVFLEEARGLP